MKITQLELFKVPPRWSFLKISTDEGLTGWGEPVIEGRASTVIAAVEEMKDYLIGKDPLRIEDHFQVLYRGGFYRGGEILMSAISGIDQALWDIKGKYYEAPVYELLGGAARDRIRVYSWIGGDRPAEAGEQAKQLAAAGMTAFKMLATEEMHYVDSYAKIDVVLERVARVREAVGREVGLAVDFHGRVHRAMAKFLAKALEPYRLMFIEEPALSENNSVLREIAHHTSIPIATGERMYTRWGFKSLLEQGYADIIQPDLSHAGRHSGVQEDLSHGGGLRRFRCPSLPVGSDCSCFLCSTGQLHAQCLHSGAEPRHSLQPGKRFARLSRRSCHLQIPRGLH
jgi:galactonate dehydratase